MEVLTVRNLTKTYGKGDTAVTALKCEFSGKQRRIHCNYRLFRVRQIYTYESHRRNRSPFFRHRDH